MRKKDLPKIGVYILLQVYDLLEEGNVKEAFEILQGDFEEVVKENPAHLFELLRDGAYDRPSAWWFYCSIGKLPQRLRNYELAMHARDETRRVRDDIRQHFDTYVTKARGREAFKVLFSANWST